MAIFYPPDAKAKDAPDGPEQYVLAMLREQLDDSWHVVPNLRIANHPRHLDGESDVVLLHPKGVIVLEVKGGRISRTPQGEWIQNDIRKIPSPILQANDNMYAVRNYLKESIERIFLSCFCCVFPESYYDAKSIEVDAGQIVDAAAIRSVGLGLSLEIFISDCLTKHERKMGPLAMLSDAEIARMAEALNPTVAGTVSPEVSVSLSKIELSHLDSEQTDYVMTLVRNDRVCLEGAAGTGKTALGLLTCFERLKANPGIRGAFICWSEYLANDVRKKVEAAGYGHRLTVFARQLEHSIDTYFWSEIYDRRLDFEIKSTLALQDGDGLLYCALGRAPGALLGGELMEFVNKCSDDGLFEGITIEDPLMNLDDLGYGEFDHDKRFDFLVVDEGQDFLGNRPAIAMINFLVKGGLLKGRVLWIQDVLQSIRGRFDHTCRTDVTYFNPEHSGYFLLPLLEKNYRNPNAVAKAAAAFRGNGYVKSRRLPSLRPPIVFIETTDGDTLPVEQAVRSLLDSGVAPDDILVISVDLTSMWKFKKGFKLGDRRYVSVVPPNLDPGINAKPDRMFVRCCDILDAKGREFPIVLLVDLPPDSNDADKSLLYVAMTRCTDSLYVAGSPQRLALYRDFFGMTRG